MFGESILPVSHRWVTLGWEAWRGVVILVIYFENLALFPPFSLQLSYQKHLSLELQEQKCLHIIDALPAPTTRRVVLGEFHGDVLGELPSEAVHCWRHVTFPKQRGPYERWAAPEISMLNSWHRGGGGWAKRKKKTKIYSFLVFSYSGLSYDRINGTIVWDSACRCHSKTDTHSSASAALSTSDVYEVLAITKLLRRTQHQINNT